MKRTSISVTPEIEQAMRRHARREGCSVSAVAHDALAAHLQLVVDPGSERSRSFIGIARSGQPSSASRIEELLAEECAPDRDR